MASAGENPGEQNPGEPGAAFAPAHRRGIPPVQARQGVTGHNVRHVLGFSLAAIMIAFAIIYVIYFV